MEDLGSPSGKDREEKPNDLVRPYVRGPGNDANRSFDDAAVSEPPDGFVPPPGEAGAHTFSLLEPASPPERDAAALPVIDAPGSHRRYGGKTGRHRQFPAAPQHWLPATAAHRRFAIIGAVAVLAVLACAVFLSLPGRSATARASKCRSIDCHQIAASAPVTLDPVTVASAASPHGIASTALPPAGSATAVEDATTPAPSVTGMATPPSSGTAAPAPSATTTVARPTPSPSATAAPSRISIRATTACCTSFYIRHDDRDNRVVITQITPGSSATVKADATWIVQAGLANRSCVSFESANDPGDYLRHFDFELYLDPNDGSSQFAQDATFCPQVGNSGEGYSFQSVNYPYEYIRHYDYVVYIASDGGRNPWDASRLWPDDTTWLVSQPWA